MLRDAKQFAVTLCTSTAPASHKTVPKPGREEPR